MYSTGSLLCIFSNRAKYRLRQFTNRLADIDFNRKHLMNIGNVFVYIWYKILKYSLFLSFVCTMTNDKKKKNEEKVSWVMLLNKGLSYFIYNLSDKICYGTNTMLVNTNRVKMLDYKVKIRLPWFH